jgi:hypothetical protein
MSNTFDNTDNTTTLANSMFTALTTGVNIPPSPDFSDAKYSFTPDTNSSLYQDINGATVSEVTDGDTSVTGSGVFDVFMQAMDSHLKREFQGNRITGSQYAEVYTAVANQVLSQSVLFTLQKDQSRWAAVTAQMQARIAEIQATEALIRLEQTKLEAANTNFQLNLTAAQYALTKTQIASEEANHDRIYAEAKIQQFQRDYLQPVELAQAKHVLYKRQPLETKLVSEKVETERANTLDTRIDGLTPVSGVLGLQKSNLEKDIAIKDFNIVNQLPKQLELLNEQVSLTAEQKESERAKTLDIRTDNQAVVGSIGKQKDLYSQQIDSFIKDAQHKTAKMYLDGFITQKTLDEGLSAPDELTQTNINDVLSGVRSNNNL